MWRWFRLITSAVGLVILLGGCASQSAPEPVAAASYAAAVTQRADFTLYEDSEYPFSLQLPNAWYVGQLSGDQYGIVAVNTNDPGQPRASINVIVEPVTDQADLEQVARTAEQTLQSQLGISGFRSELTRSATINGVQGEERIYHYTFEQQVVQQRTVYVLGSDQVYAISLIAPQDIFAQHEALFTDVLSTFQGA